MVDLEEGITYHCEALTICPHGHLDYSNFLNNLASAVLTRYEQSGRRDSDLEEGIIYHREALTVSPRGHLNRSNFLDNLINAVLTLYYQSGRMEDFEVVITYNLEAVTLCPLILVHDKQDGRYISHNLPVSRP